MKAIISTRFPKTPFKEGILRSSSLTDFSGVIALYEDVKSDVARVLKILEEKGLNYGRSGNVSVRIPDKGHIVITPSGLVKSALSPKDLLVIDIEGNVIEGDGSPTVETPLHLGIYREYEYFNAVIHAHTIYSSALAVARESIPPIIEEMVLYIGGEVRVADYAPFGSKELAENAVKALRDRRAVLLANHGVVACGRDLWEALEVLEVVERVAHIYVLSKALGRAFSIPREVAEFQKTVFLAKLKR